MSKTNIVKESIADAKEVTAIALANAKKALEETFAPQIQNMISTKLSEEADSEMSDEISENDINLDEILAELEAEEINEDEFDYSELDEILAEIEAEDESEELDESEDLDEAKKKEKKEKEEKESEEDESKEESGEDENEEVGEMTKDDLVKMIEDLINKALGKSEEMPGEEEMVGAENDEINLGEMMNDEEEMSEEVLNTLNEATKQITSLKAKLNEVNIHNAKLLYTSKLLVNNNLTLEQKEKVLKSLDKTNTLNEAKLMYETLSESFKKSFKKPISESFVSSASKSIISKNTKKDIIEVDPQISRMQKLAGIKK